MDNTKTQTYSNISECIEIASELESELNALKSRINSEGETLTNSQIDIEINKILAAHEGTLLQCLDEVKTYELHETDASANLANDTFNKLKNELKGLKELNQQLDAYKATMSQYGDMMVSSQMQFWGFLSIYMIIAYYFIRSS